MTETPRVNVPVEVWLVIDGTLDNYASVAAQSGQDAGAALELREVGWAAGAAHPERGSGFGGWPPAAAELWVAMSADQRVFIDECLASAIASTRNILSISGLHPSVRAEQESTLDLLLSSADFWAKAL